MMRHSLMSFMQARGYVYMGFYIYVLIYVMYMGFHVYVLIHICSHI